MPRYNVAKCKEVLGMLGLTEYIKLFEPRRRPRFEVNPTNQKLLTAFSDENIISSFEEDPGRPGYYKATRTRAVSVTVSDVLL